MKTLFKGLMLCSIASLCWGAQEATLLEKFESAANAGGRMLYTTGKSTVPVILVDPVEREAQLKELRAMNWKEAVVPVTTGTVSGAIYGMCMGMLLEKYASHRTASGDTVAYTQRNLIRAAAITGATVIGVKMAKTILFGYLHPKEKKRDTVSSLDTMATAIMFTSVNAL